MREAIERFPSARSWDEATYRARERDFARFEMYPLGAPLIADNRVDVLDLPDRAAFWGGPLPQQIAYSFLADTTPDLLGWLTALTAGTRTRQEIGLDIMTAMGHVVEPRLTHSHISLRAHAEGCFASVRGGAALHATYENSYRRNREPIQQRIARIIDSRSPEDLRDLDPLLAHYAAASSDTIELVRTGLRAGRFRLPTGDELSHMSRALGTEPAQELAVLAERNPVLEMVMTPEYVRFRDYSVYFQSLRLMINLAYRTLAQIGLRPVERYQLCWLTARAIEDLNGMSSLELIMTAEFPTELIPAAGGAA